MWLFGERIQPAALAGAGLLIGALVVLPRR
jgi:drug/metabolite transporter (DMT)-like permease